MIPYSQIKNLEQIAEEGFGIVYKASINGNIVAIIKIFNSQNPDKDFLNEVMLIYFGILSLKFFDILIQTIQFS
jgi:hypothetical protein